MALNINYQYKREELVHGEKNTEQRLDKNLVDKTHIL